MIRRPHSRLLLAAAAFFAVTACEEENITLDSGDPSSLEVRVYVDSNGNGEFDAGDQAIASATVTADGPVKMTETTGADGLAVFQDLIPGSYTLSLSADAPAGAVLGSATHPVVVADFRGGELRAEYRFAFRPGSITGQLYRDDNDNDQYDADTDLAAVGIGVTAERASDGEVFTTVTGDDGVFELTGLRPGTYTVTFGLPEDAELVGGESVTVQVGPDESAVIEAVFTGELVIDIADARAAPSGQSVTVEGTVIWQKGWDSRNYYIQDETGGIGVFDGAGPDLELGDRLRVTGTRGAFGGEIQISPVASREHLGNVGVPVPTTVTAADIDSGDFAGQLVTIDGTVTDVEVVNSFGTQVVTFEDAEGGAFTAFVDNRTGLGEEDWEVGTVFGVTGVLETDGDLLPRFPDDVQRGGTTVDIADARANVGASVVLQGIVTWAPPFDDRVLFFQDATGGITVFDFDLSDFEPEGGFARGDLIRIAGTVSTFSGEVQLGSISSVEVLGNVSEPSPQGTTGAEINAGDDQGELVVATGTVTGVEAFNFDNHLVTLEDAAGTSFDVFVDSRTGTGSDFWMTGNRYRITGVLGMGGGSERIETRGPDDIVDVTGETGISVAEARAMPGETVTITATVSRLPGWDGRAAFVQDATGGIAVFQSSGLPDGLEIGDQVTITGEIGAFNGEVQIAPETVTVGPNVGAPTPLSVTGAQINGGLFQGMLIEVTGTVADVEVINSFGTQEVTLATDDGARVTVFVDNRTGLSEEDWTEGETVTIVGVLGFFSGNDPGAQVEVILDTDVTFGS